MISIRIALADDELLFRKGLIALLQNKEGLDIVLEADHGLELLEQLQKKDTLPEVLLLDLKMPKMNGIAVAKIIRKNYPAIKIIIISTHFSRAFIINMIELGAAAYLPKNSSPEEVENTIRAVYEKGFHYNDKVLGFIRENLINQKKLKANFPFELSSREKEILQLICEQYTTPEIGKKLFISPRTVDGHRNNLLSKLGCKNIAGLVVFALQNQLVNIPPFNLKSS